MKKGKEMQTPNLGARKHISFGWRVGGEPPARTRTRNSIYGGIWQAVDKLDIVEQDTVMGQVVVLAGRSPWAEVQMADRLEARQAAVSLRNYIGRMAEGVRLETYYDDDRASVWVRKVLIEDAAAEEREHIEAPRPMRVLARNGTNGNGRKHGRDEG